MTVLVYPVRHTGRGWEYLLLRRKAGRTGGGFWQGVTGTAHWGEDLDEAAMRELMEETGFVPTKLRNLNYSYTFPVPAKHPVPPGTTEITEHVFVALLLGREEPTIDSHEHDEWKWCTFEDALASLKWPENIQALRQCEGVLKSLE